MASKKSQKDLNTPETAQNDDVIDVDIEDLEIDEKDTNVDETAGDDDLNDQEEELDESDDQAVEEYEEDDDMSAEEGDFDFQILPSDWKPTIEKNVKVVSQDEMLTSDAITTMEYVALIAQRVLQIQNGSELFIKKETIKYAQNAEEIAKEELKQGKFPLLIKRMIGTTHCEILDPNKMTLPRL